MDLSNADMRTGPRQPDNVGVTRVLSGTKALLRIAGYQLFPNDPVGFVKPSFRARREWGQQSNEILGIARPSLRRALDGLAYLAAAHDALGDSVEYVLLLPTISEFHLLEFLQGNEDRISKEIKNRGFMLWMYNPVGDVLFSFVGCSRDPVFRMSPLLPGLLSRELLERKPAPTVATANLFKFMPNKGFYQ